MSTFTTNISDERLIQALTTLGEDVSAARMLTVRGALDGMGLAAIIDDRSLLDAVQRAQHLLDPQQTAVAEALGYADVAGMDAAQASAAAQAGTHDRAQLYQHTVEADAVKRAIASQHAIAADQIVWVDPGMLAARENPQVAREDGSVGRALAMTIAETAPLAPAAVVTIGTSSYPFYVSTNPKTGAPVFFTVSGGQEYEMKGDAGTGNHIAALKAQYGVDAVRPWRAPSKPVALSPEP